MAEPQEFKLINIREVWPGEAKDFTPWLADNLTLLAEHLGIGELELEQTEVEVPGGRRLDILAKDPDGENWAIENQYGEADHDHLTRALAYAVGLECRAVIVVAESHGEEFTALADEWNRYSEKYGPEGIRLFLAAIEAGRIGGSVPGFRFRLVAGPNEWKSVTATGPRPPSEANLARKAKRYEYWLGLEAAMRRKGNLAWKTSRRTVHGYKTVINRDPFNFQFGLTKDSCRVELRVEGADPEANDRLFDALAEEWEVIHDALGLPAGDDNDPRPPVIQDSWKTRESTGSLEWVKDPRHRVNRINWEPDGACGYRSPPEEREAGYRVLADAMYRFHDVFMPHIEDLLADS